MLVVGVGEFTRRCDVGVKFEDKHHLDVVLLVYIVGFFVDLSR
jgi:hypothetical protein